MSIPNFKSQDHYQTFLNMFDDRWQVKFELLNRVKADMFPGYNWDQIQGKTLETINDITQSLLYNVEVDFEGMYPEYKRDDEIFIPRKTFKEDVTEALKDAMNIQCPPCDELACTDHLGE